MAAMVLYAATTNDGKIQDFAAAGVSDATILPMPGLDKIVEPVEDAPDFAGNARLKAAYYSRHAPGLLVMADDSGLEVEGLDGEPGVRSARYADDAGYDLHSGARRDDRNNAYLLDRLTWTSAWASRRARF